MEPRLKHFKRQDERNDDVIASHKYDRHTLVLLLLLNAKQHAILLNFTSIKSLQTYAFLASMTDVFLLL